MTTIKTFKRSLKLLVIALNALILSSSVHAQDIRETLEIGPKGGSIIAEDPETGVIVGLNFPEGAFREKTSITLVIHGKAQTKVLGKTHLKGISVLPTGLLLQEKAQVQVFNPPDDVNEGMILHYVLNNQFIIPLASQQIFLDENWVEGSFYITGMFNLGTPSPAEISSQCKKLASYNPSRPLAYQGGLSENLIALNGSQTGVYDFYGSGPCIDIARNGIFTFAETNNYSEECLRWQKVVTKVEAILTWVEQHLRTGNEAAANVEKRNAERALQEAIDDYLRQPSPENRCGSYGRAAGKYLKGAMLLGMDPENKSALARHYAQLADECSFVFTVETHEWISNPKQKHDDGATSEEKSNLYGTIECHIPWSHLLTTGEMKVKGKGNKTLSYENHWIGDKDNQTHQTLNGNWETDRIDGAVKVWADEFGQLHPEASITIYWQKNVTSHVWGKKPGMEKPYDFSGTDTGEEKESKSFPLKHGYEENIGNARAGMKIRVMILQSPPDDKDAPDDCF